MPTYQYTCTACEQPLEVVQSFSDAALTECPACGGRLRKVYGAVGVVFKGSGFYKTDSRSEGKGSGSSSSGGGSSSDAGAAAAPAASAPAASTSSSSSSSSPSSSSASSTSSAPAGKTA